MQLLGAAAAAWLGAQLLKFSIQAFHETPDLRLFYRSGGMPSAHAAVVTTVAVVILVLEGVNSPVFGLAAVFAAIVLYDTLGVRRSSGEQAVAINALHASGEGHPVRVVHGHTPPQVLAGIGFGTAIGLLFTFSTWASHAIWLTTSPSATEQWVYLIVFAALIGVGIVVRLVLSRYYKVAVIRRLISQLWWWLVLPGGLGLFFSVLQFQSTGSGSWRLWALLVIAAAVAAHIRLCFGLYRGMRTVYTQQVKERKRHRRHQRQRKRSARQSGRKKRK